VGCRGARHIRDETRLDTNFLRESPGAIIVTEFLSRRWSRGEARLLGPSGIAGFPPLLPAPPRSPAKRRFPVAFGIAFDFSWLCRRRRVRVRSLSSEIGRCRQKRGRGLWPRETFFRRNSRRRKETGSNVSRDRLTTPNTGTLEAEFARVEISYGTDCVLRQNSATRCHDRARRRSILLSSLPQHGRIVRHPAQALACRSKDRVCHGGDDDRSPSFAHSTWRLGTLDDVHFDGWRLVDAQHCVLRRRAG
jgi:hypothetical protein